MPVLIFRLLAASDRFAAKEDEGRVLVQSSSSLVSPYRDIITITTMTLLLLFEKH